MPQSADQGQGQEVGSIITRLRVDTSELSAGYAKAEALTQAYVKGVNIPPVAMAAGASGIAETEGAVKRLADTKRAAAAADRTAAVAARNEQMATINSFREQTSIIKGDLGNMTLTKFGQDMVNDMFGFDRDRARLTSLNKEFTAAVRQKDTDRMADIRAEQDAIDAKTRGMKGFTRAFSAQMISNTVSMGMMVPQMMLIQAATQALATAGAAIVEGITDPMKSAREAALELASAVDKAGGSAGFMASIGKGGDENTRAVIDEAIAVAQANGEWERYLLLMKARQGLKAGQDPSSYVDPDTRRSMGEAIKGRYVDWAGGTLGSGVKDGFTEESGIAGARADISLFGDKAVAEFDRVIARLKQRGMNYRWTVEGAVAAAMDFAEIEPATLPQLGDMIKDFTQQGNQLASAGQKAKIAWSWEDAGTSLKNLIGDTRSLVSVMAEGKSLSAEQLALYEEMNDKTGGALATATSRVRLAGAALATERGILQTMKDQDKALSDKKALTDILHSYDLANGSGSSLTEHERERLAIEGTTKALQSRLTAMDREAAARERNKKLADAEAGVTEAGVVRADDSALDVAARVLEAKANLKDVRKEVARDDAKQKIQDQIDGLGNQKTHVEKLINLDSLRSQYQAEQTRQLRSAEETAQSARITDAEAYAKAMASAATRDIDAIGTSMSRRQAIHAEMGNKTATAAGDAWNAAIAQYPGFEAWLNGAIPGSSGAAGTAAGNGAAPKQAQLQAAISLYNMLTIDGKALGDTIQQRFTVLLDMLGKGISLGPTK